MCRPLSAIVELPRERNLWRSRKRSKKGRKLLEREPKLLFKRKMVSRML